MFVLMGTLERSKIADDLLTTMSRVSGGLPVVCRTVVVGAFLQLARALSVQPL
jgi:TRAP-type mannitol/chloroaromatic compound transport system permease large subunit